MSRGGPTVLNEDRPIEVSKNSPVPRKQKVPTPTGRKGRSRRTIAQDTIDAIGEGSTPHLAAHMAAKSNQCPESIAAFQIGSEVGSTLKSPKTKAGPAPH